MLFLLKYQAVKVYFVGFLSTFFFAFFSKKSNISSENRKRPTKYINCSRSAARFGNARLPRARLFPRALTRAREQAAGAEACNRLGSAGRCRRAARDGNDGAKLTLDQQVADDVSRIVEVPGSRLIVACLLIRAAQPVAQALARVACDASRPPQPVPTLSSVDISKYIWGQYAKIKS